MITLAQTIAMLALSRGKGKLMQPMVHRALTRRGWIATRPFTLTSTSETYITDAGRAALAKSPHLAQAQRELDRARPQEVATGYRSDRVKRSVRK